MSEEFMIVPNHLQISYILRINSDKYYIYTNFGFEVYIYMYINGDIVLYLMMHVDFLINAVSLSTQIDTQTVLGQYF